MRLIERDRTSVTALFDIDSGLGFLPFLYLPTQLRDRHSQG